MLNPRPNSRLPKPNFSKETPLIKKFTNWFYRFMGLLESKQGEIVNIGYIYPVTIPSFIVYLMDKWVAKKDQHLDIIPIGMNKYAEVFGQRGFTFTEFKLVLSGRISEDAFERHRVYDYLYLNDQNEREYFSTLHTDDEQELLENYMAALTKSVELEIPILAFFFWIKNPTLLSG